MGDTVSFLIRFWDDQNSAAAEYIVILALIGIGAALVISIILLRGALARARRKTPADTAGQTRNAGNPI